MISVIFIILSFLSWRILSLKTKFSAFLEFRFWTLVRDQLLELIEQPVDSPLPLVQSQESLLLYSSARPVIIITFYLPRNRNHLDITPWRVWPVRHGFCRVFLSSLVLTTTFNPSCAGGAGESEPPDLFQTEQENAPLKDIHRILFFLVFISCIFLTRAGCERALFPLL